MSEALAARPAPVDRVAITLLLAYVCLLAVQWSPLPFNIQWADVLFPALLLCTIALRPFPRLLRLDMLVLLYLASSLPSLLGTTELRLGAVQLAKHGYLALLYGVTAILVARLVSPERLARWLASVAAVVAAVCLLAVALYYATGVAVPRLGAVMPLPYLGEIYRLYGAFPSPEYLMNFLAFSAPLAILQVLRSDAIRHRRTWYAALVAILVAAVFTAGHGIVGLAAALTLSLARAWRHRRPTLIAFVAIATVGLFIAVNLLLVFAVRDLQVVTSRDMTIEPPAHPYVFHDEQVGAPKVSVDLTYNFMGYWLLKELAWEAFLRKPVQGVGLGSFHNETRRAAAEGRVPAEYREIDPHSTWLGRLAETGLMGTLALAFLWVGMLRHAYRLAAAGGPPADVAVALAAGLVALLVNSPNVDVMNFRFVWLVFGALRGASARA